MDRLKEFLKVLAFPFALVFGFALTVFIFAILVGIFGLYLSWLVDLNFNGPTVLATILNALTVGGVLYLVFSKRVRSGARELWKQILRNM